MGSLTEQLHGLLEQAVSNGEIAGANLLVRRGGKEIVYTEAGFADVEAGRGFHRDTIVRLYSMTKPITAAAVMVLAERGLLDLGQSVADFLPGFRSQSVWTPEGKVPVRRDVTVKDLLNMTSGLLYPGEEPAAQEAARVFEEIDRRLYGNAPLTTAEIANALGQCALAFQPGERWMYGTSADILGAVVEQASGMRYGAFLQEALFAPLGMTDTGFYVPEEKQGRLARVYESTENGMAHYPTNHLGIRYTQDVPPSFESGGAGLASTIDDYGKFAQMLLNNGSFGGMQILKPATAAFLTQGKLTPWQQESLWRSWDSLVGYGYGNLMRVMEQPGMALCNGWEGEYGWDGWLGTYFCNSPCNGVTILLFCQRRDSGTMKLTRKIRNVLAANL